MRNIYPITILRTTFTFFLCVSLLACNNANNRKIKTEKPESHEALEENDEYDNPDKAAEFEFERTKDPALGYVPTQRLIEAQQITNDLKANSASFISAYGNWAERGPNSDVVGSSNGNSRANSGVAAGRIRAILVDAADATGKTVWVGGIDGGLWKTTDITTNPAGWVLVNDYMNNLAVTAIAQDPVVKTTMYFCTGESFSNADAVRGVGVFKSTDGGVTWNQLSSTISYTYCSRILCDNVGNIYLGTRYNGLKRSTDGGTTWTTITPTGMVSDICDLDISSTGRLHVVSGIFSTQSYRYTDIPATVTPGGWSSSFSPFPSYNMRAEIAVSGNTLYAAPADGSYQVPTIYVSTDGGTNWSATTTQPTSGWASGQGWYALSMDINPANPNQCIVGGLDTYKTTNGGLTWTKISAWVGTGGQYVHADQHKVVWYDNGNKLLFGCDGGIHYSTDGGTTIRDRNTGLRIKQFYACAVHPTNVNYFLAGAQDNGSHAFSAPGLGVTTEVTGGDGAFVHIDQNEPQYQFTSYVYNQYRRSTNGGASWSSVNFSGSTGRFINPTDYDDIANIMYCANTGGTYKRWTDPQTGSANDDVSISALNGNNVTALYVSPNTANRLYLGTSAGSGTRVCYVDNANSIASGSAGMSINTGLPTNTSVSCIAAGSDDNNLMVSYSNYGVQQIWVSTTGGTSWTNIDGNLPDMPVRWCMFGPGINSKAIIATETGVWITEAINGSSTVWMPSQTFPTVRTDMLQYRSSDGMIAAATHGRGLWTQDVLTVLPLNNFILKGSRKGNNIDLNWNYEGLSAGAVFEPEISADGLHYTAIGAVQRSAASNYSYAYTPPSNQIFYYRIKGKEQTGAVKYSNIVRLGGTGTASKLEIVKLYPNPAKEFLSLTFTAAENGKANYFITTANGQTVWEKEETLRSAGSYSITENISSLKAGTYVFTVMLNGKKTSKTFTKLQ